MRAWDKSNPVQSGTLQVGSRGRLVLMRWTVPVTNVELDVDEARKLGEALIERARQASVIVLPGDRGFAPPKGVTRLNGAKVH